MIGVFMIGQRANLFRKKFPYETQFVSAAGLDPGQRRVLNGVVVGNVLEVNLSGDPGRPHGPRRLRRRAALGAHAPQGHARLDQDAGPARRQVHRARGGTADEPEVPIGGEIPAAPGRRARQAPRGQRRPPDGPRRRSPSRSRHPRPHREGRRVPRRHHVGERGEQGARQQLQRRAPLAQRHPRRRSTRARASSAGCSSTRSTAKETSESLAGAFRSVQSLLAKIDEGVRTGAGRDPGAALGPRGQEEDLRAGGQPGRRPPRTSRAVDREPGEGQRRHPDPPERPAVRKGVHGQPPELLASGSTRSRASSTTATGRRAS